MNETPTNAEIALGNGLLSAIGLVAVEWSYLEAAVEACLLEFGNYIAVPQRVAARIFTVHLQTITRLESLESMIRVAISEKRSTFVELDTVVALNKRVNDLIGERNKIIHAIWMSSDVTTGIMTARGKKMFRQEIAPYSAGEVKAVAYQIADLTDDYRKVLLARNASPMP